MAHKRTSKTANDKIKARLKSGKSKPSLTEGLVSYDEPGYPGGRFRKTGQASSSAPEGNSAKPARRKKPYSSPLPKAKPSRYKDPFK